MGGIGTYSTETLGLWGRFKRWWSETLDQGVGTTFDQHIFLATALQ